MMSILLGPIIGLGPSSLLATYQARQQREQLLVDRRITALKEFAAAVNGNGELLGKLDQLENGLTVLSEFPNDQDVRKDVSRLSDEIAIELPRYLSSVRVNGLIMTSVFKVPFNAPKFPTDNVPRIALDKRLPKTVSEGLTKTARDFREVIHTLKGGLGTC